ncbi:MAG TPA: hypothetical protein VGP07_14470 [Polyangia bacterium]|jgi:hypothetical protein
MTATIAAAKTHDPVLTLGERCMENPCLKMGGRSVRSIASTKYQTVE